MKTYVRLLGTTEQDKPFKDYTIVSAMYSTMFKPLMSAVIFLLIHFFIKVNNTLIDKG